MKIIILGAGQVGGTLAENLVGENNDITIVDTNGDRLRGLQDKFDLRVVQGHGSHPRVLREAGADDADMLVAVTSSDETNMVACQVAYSLFNTPNRIARKADIVGVSSLRRGVAEAIEAVAHGDETTSRVVGRTIDEIKLPPGTIIGAVVRGNDVMIANDNLRIEQGDHVIMFLTDKKFITDVERLFQPSPFFL